MKILRSLILSLCILQALTNGPPTSSPGNDGNIGGASGTQGVIHSDFAVFNDQIGFWILGSLDEINPNPSP